MTRDNNLENYEISKETKIILDEENLFNDCNKIVSIVTNGYNLNIDYFSKKDILGYSFNGYNKETIGDKTIYTQNITIINYKIVYNLNSWLLSEELKSTYTIDCELTLGTPIEMDMSLYPEQVVKRYKKVNFK